MKQLSPQQQRGSTPSAAAEFSTRVAPQQSDAAAMTLTGRQPQPKQPPPSAAQSPAEPPELARRTSKDRFAQPSRPAAGSTQPASSPPTTSSEYGDGSAAHEPGPDRLVVRLPVSPHHAAASPSRAWWTSHPAAERPQAASVPAQRDLGSASAVRSHSAPSESEPEDEQPPAERLLQKRSTRASPSEPSYSSPAAAELPAYNQAVSMVGEWNRLVAASDADDAATRPAAPPTSAAQAQSDVTAGKEVQVPPRKRHKAGVAMEPAFWTSSVPDEYELPDSQPASPAPASPAASLGTGDVSIVICCVSHCPFRDPGCLSKATSLPQ